MPSENPESQVSSAHRSRGPRAQGTKQARELGQVRWKRDLDATLRERPSKPVLVLFQEVPG